MAMTNGDGFAEQAAADAARFKKTKLLTRPTLKFLDGIPRYVRIETVMVVSKEIKSRTPNTNQNREPATVCDVIDLTTGEEAQIVCAAIVKSTLMESYPNDSYVGKSFSITKMKKEENKNYNRYRIEEIEDTHEKSTKKGK
jgi:hypothetical protein